jgi:3'-phosphoadenosine 5'-phosphosulfate sulfotransferase (PAPS reductase)/FAD synthetase
LNDLHKVVDMDEAERLMFQAWASMPPYRRKVAQAQSIIKEALEISPAYVACSWGKDSLVLAHLVWNIAPSTLLLHDGSDDEDEQDNYSEVREAFLGRFPMPYQGIVRGYNDGSGGGLYEQLPSHPLVFLGLRAEENKTRKISLRKYGPLHQYQSDSPLHPTNSWRCCPLAWWNWKDVWAYIVAHDLPYLSAYDWEPKNQGRTSVIHGKRINPKHSGLGSGQSELLRRRNPEFWEKLTHA